jgi:O-antigen ligase
MKFVSIKLWRKTLAEKSRRDSASSGTSPPASTSAARRASARESGKGSGPGRKNFFGASLPAAAPADQEVNFMDQVDSWGRALIIGASGGLLIFAPLAYGAVHPWSYFSLSLLVGVLSLLLLLRGLYSLWAQPGALRLWPHPPLGWVAAGFGLLLCLQVVPLPRGLVGLISPTALEIRALGNGWGLANFLPLSLNPYNTMLEALKLAPAVGLFFVLLYAITTRRQLLALALVILSVASFEVAYGFYHFRSPKIWGWPSYYVGQRFCGTFINSNHLGSFLTMAILLGLGLALAQTPAGSRVSEGNVSRRLWLWAENIEPYFRSFLLVFLMLILTVGLIFSGSRGALLALVVGLGLMGLLIWRQNYAKGHLFVLAMLLVVAVLYSLWLGSAQYLARFTHRDDIGRYYTLLGALALFRDFPWLGGGLGTFADLFYRYEPAQLQGVSFAYAHSDWLQLLTETGVIGLGLLVLGIWLFFSRLMQQWQRRHDRFARGLGLGGIAALAAVLFHALGEFPFHTPAISLIFASIAAVTYLALHHHRLRESAYFSYPTVTITNRRSAVLVLSLLLAVQVALLVLAIRFWRAELAAPTEIDSTQPVPTLRTADFRRALTFNASNSKYYLGLAEALERGGLGQDTVRQEVEQALKQAIFYAPAHWGYRLQLGDFYLRYYQSAPAYYIPQGLQELAAAVKLFPESGELRLYLATYLTWAKENHPSLVPPGLSDAAPSPQQ